MNQAENPGKSSAAVFAVVVALLLPVVSVLSLGPAVMIVDVTMTSGDRKTPLNQVKVAGAGQQPPDGAIRINSTRPSSET